MNRHCLVRFLLVLFGVLLYVSTAGSAPAAPDASKLPPGMLKGIEEHVFGFTIGPVVTNSGGFQPCQGLSGYLQNPKEGNEMASDAYSINYCVTGSVTVKQKSITDMAGKTVDLIVANWHITPNPYNPSQWSPNTHTYRLPFQSKDTVVFGRVSFGSGLVDNPAQYNGKQNPNWITQHFKDQVAGINADFYNPRPVRLEVRYNGRGYATANCAFQSSQSGATVITCQGSPSPPVASAPHSPPTPSPVGVQR